MNFKKIFNRKNRKIPRPKRPEYQDKTVQPSLPKARTRTLTLHGPCQQTSRLLSSLPIELRRLVYEAILGHRKVHVVFEFGPREYRSGTRSNREYLEWRWWHCICTWDQIHDLYKDHWDNCRSGKMGWSRGPPNGMMGKLKLDFAILLTCRQVYCEAIDILYSTTTFKFATRELLCSFPTQVLPHRFALISSIDMKWTMFGLCEPVISDADKQLYHDTWAMLSRMPRLQRIRITVVTYRCPDPAQEDLQEVWLGPLKQLERRDFIELHIPESYAQCFSVDQESNFTLRTFRDSSWPRAVLEN